AEGRQFLAQFGATQSGRRVDEASVYDAAATEVLLDGIARSDGSRASVARELLTTQAGRGPVGAIRFDASGDVARAPIAILTARRAGGADTIGSHDGATVETVL